MIPEADVGMTCFEDGRGGATIQGLWGPLGPRKGQDTDSPQSIQEKPALWTILIRARGD